MPPEFDAELEAFFRDSGSLSRGRFHYIPVAPGRVEFAVEVRKDLLARKPRVVAVELPVTLQTAYVQAVERLPQITVLVYPDEKDEERGVYVVVEPADPFTEAIRTGMEIEAEIVFCDPDLRERPHLPDLYPDPYSLRHIGLDKYVEAYRVYPQPRSDQISQHAAGIARKLQGTNPQEQVAVILSMNLLDPVLDAMERPQEELRRRRRQRDVTLVNPHPECLAEITVEYPYLQARYEQFRATMTPDTLTDRLRSQMDLFREAEKSYEANAGERISAWQRRYLARYSRNLALTAGDLTCGLFDLTVAARSIADDNYAWEVWENAGRYPYQKAESNIETISLSGEEVWWNTRRLRLRRRIPRMKRLLRPANLKVRKKEKFKGEWAQQFNGNAICSYPPEDLVVEDYGRFLKQKAKSILSDERTRTEPFTTSVLDGIDLRETIRNWHEGKIYVRQFEKVYGEVGSLVVIFDEDQEQRYSYLTTWLGEHQNESDMAFYSTEPFEHLVGPGIGRAEYGGFLMSLPPRRMMDVWSDPDYDVAESKPERLLLAAIDYSVQRYVVYVAAHPPRSVFRSIASRLGRSILYIPIGQLSPQKLKKVRVVHVLDGYSRRDSAKDYIW
jgi:hypothetical protein